MLLKEYMSGKNLFAAIQTVKPFPFIENPADLDLMLTINYGERTVFRPMEDMDVETLARLLVTQYGKAWDNLVEQQLLWGNVNRRREVTETVDSTENRTSTRNDVNKVSAYNSEELIDDGGSNASETGDTEGTRTRTMIDEEIDVKNSLELLSIGAKQSIIRNVLIDTSNFFTLYIY